MRPLVTALLALALLQMGALTTCQPGGPDVQQEVVTQPGYVEPHTPGSGAPEELAPSATVTGLLGASADLNRVTTVRTRVERPDAPPPNTVLILIPGFLGGATTFDPVARDLVARMNGGLEVWAVDRRPNQLEDRLGAEHAVAGAEESACTQSPPLPECSIFEGAQFYFPDQDAAPTGNFPGPEDLDLDLDGELDPQLPLDDGSGARGPLLLSQDDARFMAWWGLDTYFRDWKLLVEEARGLVGPEGTVLIGGHSQGTTWSSLWVAYDFDPDPTQVEAGHELVDGLVLLEGGGAGSGSGSPPTLAEYEQTVAELAQPGGPDVFLEDFSQIPLQALGTSGEVAAIAAYHQPFEPSLIQRTPTFGSGLLPIILGAPATNRAIVGLFLDDDFSPISAFRASVGFSDDYGNTPLEIFGPSFYVAQAAPGGALRTWKDAGDPTLPSVLDVPPCDPLGAQNGPADDAGCAIVDNGPPSGPGESPRTNGLEAEVTPIDAFVRTQFGKRNGFEWYFAAGRPSLDFSYGRDSSGLVDQALAVDPGHEGPLVVTQNAQVDVPVIAIGGSNGLTPEPKSFDSYLGSIATPAAWKEVHIVPGYAHLDPLNAANNQAVPLLEDFLVRVRQQKLLETFE